jgi:hypothetical protein
MRFIKTLVMLLGTVLLSGLLALGIAFGIASLGLLGTCAEGACEYAALFVAFPLLWLGLLLVTAVVYGLRRRKARNQ